MFPKKGSGERLNTRLNAQGGFTPAAVAPPECDNPRPGTTHHHSLSAGAVRGDRECSLLIQRRASVFHTKNCPVRQLDRYNTKINHFSFNNATGISASYYQRPDLYGKSGSGPSCYRISRVSAAHVPGSPKSGSPGNKNINRNGLWPE